MAREEGDLNDIRAILGNDKDASCSSVWKLKGTNQKRITKACLRNRLQALVRRTNGIESILGPNVHSAFADCRSCVDVRVELVDRQNFPIASST